MLMAVVKLEQEFGNLSNFVYNGVPARLSGACSLGIRRIGDSKLTCRITARGY
jgi:hypothetical protein